MKKISEKHHTHDTIKNSGSSGIKSDHEAYQLYRNMNIYDTVFKLFFQNVENIRKFYVSLTHQEVRVENIEKVTLEEGTSFDSQLKNDLGFLVKNDQAQDEFVILTEAQSTWNDNMPYRFLEYVTTIFREYVKSHNFDKYHGRIYLPRARFYLIYTGKQTIPDKLRFSETHYRNVRTDNDDLSFGVTVFSTECADTVQGQYIGFCKIVSALRTTTRDHVEFVSMVLKECCNKGYKLFQKFIEDNKAEMEEQMEQVFYNERVFSDYIQTREKVAAKNAIEKATPQIAKDAVEKATPQIAKDAVEKATPQIVKDAVEKATPQIAKDATEKANLKMIVDLYKDHLISVEVAASKLNMNVPAFEEMLSEIA